MNINHAIIFNLFVSRSSLDALNESQLILFVFLGNSFMVRVQSLIILHQGLEFWRVLDVQKLDDRILGI